jgi:hypothetical protein
VRPFIETEAKKDSSLRSILAAPHAVEKDR